MSLRLLVLDAYDVAGRAALSSAGATLAGELYRRLLQQLEPDAAIDVAAFAPDGFSPPAPLASYDGIVWTGSNLTIHRDTPAVRRHLDLARAAFAAGVPSFGSCWAVHVAVTAAGGECAANPLGREFGVARTIVLNQAGRAHPMFAGKPAAFDALASHEDHVVRVGPTTTVLASNDLSPVQAVHVTHQRGAFWATQYHPEYGLRDVADLGVLRAPQLISQGFFADADAADAYLRELQALDRAPAQRDLAYRLGVGRSVLDPQVRTCEVRNWLEHAVKPSTRR
ncbi:MAG: type 1 glutamine amidotransferase [Deltaproteobacteria bacterium]|nr:type 1 glutamine amidotransferase [Deltaproteobacteria bacterium]